MRKIHICYLISSLCNEGPVNVMYNIIRYIDFQKFKVSIITFIPEKDTSRFKDFEQLPINIYQLEKSTKLSPWKLFSLLKEKLNEINPDELHAHCPRSLYLMCFLPKRYKRIYTIHIYPGLQQHMLYGKFKGNCVIFLNNYFTRKCDLPIGCSESVGFQYKEEKGWNIKCIPNGTSLPKWEHDIKEKNRLRSEFGLKSNIKYFIFIGRFSKEKNPDILIECFNNIKRDDIGLIMLGQGPMWKSLKEKAGDNIIMPGFTTRVYDYLKAADYYISASDVEGLANTILESISIGLPMLLSDIPSHREVLNNIAKERIGYVMNASKSDIEEKVNLILKLNPTETCNILQQLYCNKYTAEVMSKAYQEAYMNLIK